jgi:hypothetical protein
MDGVSEGSWVFPVAKDAQAACLDSPAHGRDVSPFLVVSAFFFLLLLRLLLFTFSSSYLLLLLVLERQTSHAARC